MKSILGKFIGFNVVIAQTNGVGISGELIEIDQFGITVLGHVDSDHEVKEKVAVYIPHKNIDYVSAREDSNQNNKELLSYEDLFGAK
jgi:small nuclear ribonucleoprotein (snRNP)-like protein